MDMLVLGGTRLIGKHLVNALLEKGHRITVATRGITEDDFGDRVTRVVVDRCSKESLKDNIPDVLYDVVFDDLAYCSNDVKHLLDIVKCKKYVQVSSASVYPALHDDTKEEEFNAGEKALLYCGRSDFEYDEIKRQAECAIVQTYAQLPSVRVRFPFVIGADDYTKRLFFYVEHIVNQKPMFIDNLKAQMAFVRSDEAGRFLAFVGESEFTGAINGANEQTISIEEIVDYVKLKTGKSPVLSESGEPAPYNGADDYFLNLDRAKALGFSFTPLSDWIYGLIDFYITAVGIV